MCKVAALIKKTTLILGSLLLVMTVYGNNPEKKFLKTVKDDPYDAIIVPGVPYKEEAWQAILKNRIHWAVYLYKKGIAKHIIFSGSAVYTPYIESRIMAMYAIELGVPDTVIITEELAEHSVENVYNGYKLAQHHGYSRVALATDPFLARMMKWASRNIPVNIDFLPYVEEILQTLSFPDVEIEHDKAYVDNFISIVDRESFWKRIKGTFGKKIKD